MSTARIIPLPTGATARGRGPVGAIRAVVCVDGGSGRETEGDWSATLEWLVGRIAPALPDLRLLEVRYRIKSWRRLDLCIEDCLAALNLAQAEGARELCLLGFSMGGAVSIASAGHPAVSTMVGLAPWIPDRLDVSPVDGRRVAVVHGALDAWLPGVPGVSPRQTLRGVERIRARGVDATHTLIPGGLHGVAVRGPWGRAVPLPRARTWLRLVREELERFRAERDTAGRHGAAGAGRGTAA